MQLSPLQAGTSQLSAVHKFASQLHCTLLCWEICVGSIALYQVSPVSDSELQTILLLPLILAQSPWGRPHAGPNAPYSLMVPALACTQHHCQNLHCFCQLSLLSVQFVTVDSERCLHTPAVLVLHFGHFLQALQFHPVQCCHPKSALYASLVL